MKRALYILAIATGLSPLAGHCGTGRTDWGAPVSEQYDIWGWMSAYGDEGADTWDSLSAAMQERLLEKAIAACERSDARLGATNNQTNGKAILSLSAADLEQMGVCLKNGRAVSSALEEKRARLAEILGKADNGVYDEADMAWLRRNGITLEHNAPARTERTRQREARARRQEKISAAADKKYGKMRGLNADGLSNAYDGTDGTGHGGGDAAEIDLAGKKPKGMAALNPEARGPKKKLTSTAPPEIAGGGPEEKPVIWNGERLPRDKQRQVEKCRTEKCGLYDMLRIVDPKKLAAVPSYQAPADRAEIARMEKSFKELLGRDLTFSDLERLRNSESAPASGYEDNNLAALEHKYYVREVIDSGSKSWKDQGGTLAGYIGDAAHHVVMAGATLVYENGKAYMLMEVKAAKGDPLAMAGVVLSRPLGLAMKAVVLGSNGKLNTKNLLSPSESNIGSMPSLANVTCAFGFFCGDNLPAQQ